MVQRTHRLNGTFAEGLGTNDQPPAIVLNGAGENFGR